MIDPIPSNLLIHEVQYEEYDGLGRYGDDFKPPITLRKVRVEMTSGFMISGTEERRTYNALLFFDAVHSKPTDVVFKKKSKVTYNGETMVVSKVNPVYAFDLHHFEVELM